LNGRVFSGIPTNAGNFGFILKATDAYGCTGTNGYSLPVNCPAITISPPTLAAPIISMAYNQTNRASGGTAPYRFSAGTGSMPAGLTLSSTGVLSGTPTNIGHYSFTIVATDAYGCTGIQSNTWAVDVLILKPFMDSNDWFRAEVAGPAGGTFVVLASTNLAQPLSNWVSLATNIATSGIFGFVHTNSPGLTNPPQQFYRVRLSQ
jgi:hypothetical protein